MPAASRYIGFIRSFFSVRGAGLSKGDLTTCHMSGLVQIRQAWHGRTLGVIMVGGLLIEITMPKGAGPRLSPQAESSCTGLTALGMLLILVGRS